MATKLELLKPLRLYKTGLRFPSSLIDKNKQTGSLVFILSSSIDHTISFLKNNSFLINNGNYFRCYYTEKEFMYIMDESGYRYNDNSIIHSVIESASGESDPHINNIYLKINKPNDLSAKLYYPEAVEKLIYNEDFGTTQNYPMIFRQMLYNDRIKNQKELTNIYKKVKSEVDWIKYTYPSLKTYKNKNLIVDLSYYTNLFLDKNIYQLDKGVDIFHHLVTKMIEDKRYSGYNRRTVIIPVEAWMKDGEQIFDYRKYINPFSMIGRLVKTKKVISDYWNGIEFLICSKNAYFKVDFSNFTMKELYKFIILTNKLIANEIGEAEEAPEDEETVEEKKLEEEKSKETVYTEPDKVPAESNDEEWIKSIVADLNEEPVSKVSESRIQRMNELDKEFDNTEFNGKKVGTVLNEYYTKDRSLKSEKIPIKNINEEWSNIKAPEMNKQYDINEDILAILKSFRYKSRPLSVVKISMDDASTFEDYIYLLKVTFEDINGVRSNIELEIPKFINSRFMKLRGNTKTINGQLMLIPIIKAEEDTAQVVTSYRKIFIYRINPSNGSKSTKGVSKLTKVLGKLDLIPDTKVEVYEGDNSFICSKYELPIEFRDLAGLYTRINMKDGSYISFDYNKNFDLLEKQPHIKYNDMTDICVGWDNTTKKPIIFGKENVAFDIGNFIASKDKPFAELYDKSTPSDKLSYSEANIMTTKIPVIVLMAYCEGLQKAMNKAHIRYRFSETRPKITNDESYIKFSDGYLIYNDAKPEDSLLMSGLCKCDLSDYSIKEINKKNMWLDQLDNFGGRIKADGLDNFYDCMFDPMSIDICKKYKLPYDFVEALGYASGLLADTHYNKHSDISGNRIRTNEVVAGYLYQEMCKSYGEYATKSKRTGKGVKFTIKKSAVIDALMKDPGFADFSVNNPILEAESMNTMSFKGLSGMNADRAYTLDKRIYNDSMMGVLSTSTGFASTVGVSRQATVNATIENTRGLLRQSSTEDLETLNTMSVYEALAPYTVTHDDPIRTAMGFIQTKSHQMRVKSSSPNLLTYGMDEALPYFTSNLFTYKFTGKKGRVISVDEDFIVYEEIDENNKKSRHLVNLQDQTMKNSDGGFFVTLHLKPMVKKGDVLKYNDILAYDPTSFSKAIGTEKKDNILSYNIGTLAKVAIMTTDEAYEDSSIIDERLADALTTYYCVEKDCSIAAESNVFYIAKKGQEIQEGEPLMVFQNAFDEKEANVLLKNISDDETMQIANDFGRIQIRSKLTGVIQDIKIYRTCEYNDMSSSIKKIVKEYDNTIKAQKDKLIKSGVDKIEIESIMEPVEMSKQEGKLKNLEKGVMFCFYIKCTDIMGVGDKMVYNTAVKGVIKDIIPSGDEPYTDFRPNEPIDALLTTSAVNARMVGSVMTAGALTKVILELSRKCKEILGIEWTNLKNTDNLK
ncbi:MAG: hypothetical protein IJ193_00190 [Bacilli bacterium]|nr:hypothetical protein [Bacilli bacterium]